MPNAEPEMVRKNWPKGKYIKKKNKNKNAGQPGSRHVRTLHGLTSDKFVSREVVPERQSLFLIAGSDRRLLGAWLPFMIHNES